GDRTAEACVRKPIDDGLGRLAGGRQRSAQLRAQSVAVRQRAHRTLADGLQIFLRATRGMIEQSGTIHGGKISVESSKLEVGSSKRRRRLHASNFELPTSNFPEQPGAPSSPSILCEGMTCA